LREQFFDIGPGDRRLARFFDIDELDGVTVSRKLPRCSRPTHGEVLSLGNRMASPTGLR